MKEKVSPARERAHSSARAAPEQVLSNASVPAAGPGAVLAAGRPVTQRQIADEVGVTQQLVALALQNNPRVATETRRRIWDTAARLGYDRHANRHARALAAERHGRKLASDILAVVLEPMSAMPAASDPYFRSFLDGIESEAGRRNLDVLIVPLRPTGLPWLVTQGWVDGVIALGAHHAPLEVERAGLPTVALGAAGNPGLVPDDFDGTRQITQHLLDLGHRRIAYARPRDWTSAQLREDGWRHAMERAGIGDLDELVDREAEGVSLTTGAGAWTRLRARTKFTALVCHNDPMAMGVVQAAQAAGVAVPRALSVAGFDDVSPAYHFQPAITSVRFDATAMGRRAVAVVCEINAAGEGEQVSRSQTFPVTLSVRASTAPPQTRAGSDRSIV